ncbi:deoxyguanosine kinase, partial [Mycoplasmopsis pullorum]
RPAEINNWDANLEYWAKLHSIYKTKFIQICEEFNVKYQILDTNNKNEEQVLAEAKAIIHEYQQSLKLKEQHENSN